jgi:hypothetical protein
VTGFLTGHCTVLLWIGWGACCNACGACEACHICYLHMCLPCSMHIPEPAASLVRPALTALLLVLPGQTC